MKTSTISAVATLALGALLFPLSTARAQHEGHVMPAASAKMPAQRDTTGRERTASPYQKTPHELLSAPMLEEHLRSLPEPVHDSQIFSFLYFELFEVQFSNDDTTTFAWDFNGWIGGDHNRLWIKSEGEQDLTGKKTGEGDLQLLYGRLIAPYWDFQIGARALQNLGAGSGAGTRTYGVIGVQGLAPYMYEFEPAIYISDRGEVSAALTASADLFFTQRLVLQPRFESIYSLQGDPEFGVGRRGGHVELGLRLRYHITREFAPYAGVSWLRTFGGTADLRREEGERAETLSLVTGVRFWW